MVVADTDAEALAIARRAYPRWRANFFWLFERHGSAPRVAALYPKSFDEVAALGIAVAGSPATVRDFIAADIAATGANYWTPWLAFGDMTTEEALRSVELFAREVMPAFNSRCEREDYRGIRPANPPVEPLIGPIYACTRILGCVSCIARENP